MHFISSFYCIALIIIVIILVNIILYKSLISAQIDINFKNEMKLFTREKLIFINFSKYINLGDLYKARKKSSYRKIGYGGHPNKYIFSFPLDEKILINPYIKNNIINLLVIVHSRPEEFYERLQYRKGCLKYDQTKIIYITSKSINNEVNNKLILESKIYNDILQFNETSSYFNLSIQTAHMILWCGSNIQFNYLLKTDVDVFINIPFILKKIQKYQTKSALYAMGRLSKAYVIRNKKYSHYVPRNIINENMFPPYLQGVGYIIPYNTIKILAQSIKYVNPKIWIEDVFMGYLFKYNNISLIDFSEYILREINNNISYILSNINKYMLIHGFYPIEIYLLNKIISNSVRC